MTARVNSDGTLTRDPFPGSAKCYVEGSDPSIRVPMRAVRQTPSKRTAPDGSEVLEPNADVLLYDTSGPYTDPAVRIDVREGLAPLRRNWILERGDVDELDEPSSETRREHLADPGLDGVRFPSPRRPLRATPGRRVTQMHYARRGEITPEMEFIAIRENARREEMRAHAAGEHPGQSFGASIPAEITPPGELM